MALRPILQSKIVNDISYKMTIFTFTKLGHAIIMLGTVQET